ncbi:MAG: (d)CMP kinase [Mycoplasmataceae bacterium]|nr:(d)CMP kinase [Mycoplasmataceae bacterium]
MINNLRIAIDGGAATGKSTISKMVAKKLNITYINTGQMYRLFALITLRNNILDNEKDIFDSIKNINLSFDRNGKIISNDICFMPKELETKEISLISSKIATMPLVRKIATEKQILLGKQTNVLLEGRDIGSVIMIDATHKFFITIKPEIAAKRRVKQYKSLGEEVLYDEILIDIIERNKRDTKRKISPLIPTQDSYIIDSSYKTAKEVSEIIVGVINNG